MNKTIRAAALTLGMTLLGGNAAEAKELKFYALAPEVTPWGADLVAVAKGVEVKTGGSIRPSIFVGGPLGNEQDVSRQVVRGRVHFAYFSNTGGANIVPEFALVAAPYIWDSVEQANCVLDTHLLSVFRDLFREAGLEVLGFNEIGHMVFFFKDQIEDPAALSGLKIRVAPTITASALMEAAGAIPVVMSPNEATTAIQTGLTAGSDGVLIYALNAGLGKVAPHLLVTNHSRQIGIFVMHKGTWDELGKEEQAAFREVVGPKVRLREQVMGAEAKVLEKHLKEGGMVHQLGGGNLAAWRALGMKSRKEIIEKTGGHAAQVLDQIEEGKAACK